MFPKKIQYVSDLHLEFPKNNAYIKANPLKPKGDILILAGDIVPFAILNKHQDFFSYLADHFEMTYWIPGNHEYYYFDIAEKSGVLWEEIKSNVVLLNNTAIQLQDTKLIFSTLWSKISPANKWYLENNLSDFHVIQYKGKTLRTEIYNQLHAESLHFIQQELQTQNQGKTVVVTHHVPTYMNYPEIYKGSKLNEGFAVETFDTIESSRVDYWIYGHSHFNTAEFSIGNTKMLTNQLGYIHEREHLLFNPDATIIF
jgi:predicted phosphohydrolase